MTKCEKCKHGERQREEYPCVSCSSYDDLRDYYDEVKEE